MPPNSPDTGEREMSLAAQAELLRLNSERNRPNTLLSPGTVALLFLVALSTYAVNNNLLPLIDLTVPNQRHFVIISSAITGGGTQFIREGGLSSLTDVRASLRIAASSLVSAAAFWMWVDG